MNSQKRNAKLFRIPEHEVLDLFDARSTKVRGRVVLDGLPADAKVHDVRHEPYHACFCFMVYSQEFPDVPACEMLPDAGRLMFRCDEMPEPTDACEMMVATELDGSQWVQLEHHRREIVENSRLKSELQACFERCERLEQENMRLKDAARGHAMTVRDGFTGDLLAGKIGFLFVEDGAVANIHGPCEIGEISVHGGTVNMPASPNAVGVMSVTGGKIGQLLESQKPYPANFQEMMRLAGEGHDLAAPNKVLEDLEMRRKYREMTGVECRADPAKIRKALGLAEPVEPPQHFSNTRCTTALYASPPDPTGLYLLPDGTFGTKEELDAMTGDKAACTCPIQDLMVRGCTCGAPK